ncbi:histidine kinase [Agromyces sp. H3Y2-19a]|jgi:signal transduction histidine kinase|uniref:sensor histidine kinase n=1 Tax=Agromyces TaxID=33877 RepID=UPI001E44E3CF|nr:MULTISPECIES: ATP-binding protein [Agromyces]MCD5347700.1 histidine kinase [Agromyces sp. S2-1-8]MDF0514729.1 histidine kinase [Agromyces chromiiresistens]
MKRIHKERDRLLRRIARIAGLSGAIGALACMLIPSSAGPLELGVVVLLGLVTAVLVVVHTAHGSVPAALGVVASSLATVAVLGSAEVDPVAFAAMSLTGAAAAPSVAITLIVRPGGVPLVVSLGALSVVVAGVIVVSGHTKPTIIVATIAGWSVGSAIGLALDHGIAGAAARIDEIGRAHEAERIASETEARQRQDARVLHDTVLATLSLLAHSGVGVGAAALRQQAGDDARLLKQLRLGASLDNTSNAIFSPDSDEDLLSTTFESVRQRFARMGLDVNWHGVGQLALPRETLDALLGALGECLENVRRHSGVNEADVTVSDDDRTVRAMVTDAGHGFAPESVDPARLGYAESVVGRLHTVGGRARIFSSPGSGTTVMLEVPKP